jgi:glycosyltransferase 2 family protein
VRNALRLAVGILVSLGCLYFATAGTDWALVADSLAHAHPLWTAGAALLGIAAVYIRAQRWRVLLRPIGDVALYPALSATAIGFGASSVLPFRLGEILRPALLGRRAGVTMSAAMSSVVLERLLDVLLVVSCFLGVSIAYPLEDDRIRTGAYVLAGLAGGALVVLTLLARSRETVDRLIGWVLAFLPARLGNAIRPMATSFASGLAALANGRTVLIVLAYSVYLWGVIALTFLFGMLALDIDVPLVPASLATVVIVAAFVFLPQAPGFVGTWQAGCVVALALFHVRRDVAVSFSFLTWIVQMVVNLGVAGIFLAREDFSLGQLLRVAERDAARGVES